MKISRFSLVMWQTDDEVSKNEKETKQTGGNDHEKKNIEGSKYLKNTCVVRTFVTNSHSFYFFYFFTLISWKIL